MSYVYIKTEPGLWTVGFYDPNGKFVPESDHGYAEDAAKRVAWLNGGSKQSQVNVKSAPKPVTVSQSLANEFPEGEVWIEWRGGDRPVIAARVVEVKMRFGDTDKGEAGLFRWDHLDSSGDIIAYRIHKPALDDADTEGGSHD